MRFRSRLAVIVAAAFLAPPFGAATDAPRATMLTSLTWREGDAAFGGFSGIDIAADGRAFTVISDRGTIRTGTFLRDADERMTGIEGGPSNPLRRQNGTPLEGLETDAEDIAVAPDGTLYVSFEGMHRVAEYARPDAPARTLPRPRAFDDFQSNSSLESLAIGPDGTLYTLPERSGAWGRPFPVWRFRDGAWDQPFAIPRDGRWLAVGADIGPDGRFYLLERDFWGILGFLTRVRRFEMDETGLSGGEVLLRTTAGVHDNLEGIAAWRDARGRMRITLIADDNFRFLQRTEVVEYLLDD